MDEVTNEQTYLFGRCPVFGAIVAVADLVECWPMSTSGLQLDLTPLERIFGDFSPGRYAYQLENIIRLSPAIACDGKQGFWYPPSEVVNEIRDRMTRPVAI